MASLRPVTYENVRWEPQGVRYASAALPKYGTCHPALPASITDLVLDLSLIHIYPKRVLVRLRPAAGFGRL